MTNLIFQIITLLVTNVSEIQAPKSIYDEIVTFPMWPSYIPPPPPKTKSTYTTCHRVTNAVARFGADISMEKELGRELLWDTTEDFVEVTTWKSQGVRTNDYSNLTNSLRMEGGLRFNTNQLWIGTNGQFPSIIVVSNLGNIGPGTCCPTTKLHVCVDSGFSWGSESCSNCLKRRVALSGPTNRFTLELR